MQAMAAREHAALLPEATVVIGAQHQGVTAIQVPVTTLNDTSRQGIGIPKPKIHALPGQGMDHMGRITDGHHAGHCNGHGRETN